MNPDWHWWWKQWGLFRFKPWTQGKKWSDYSDGKYRVENGFIEEIFLDEEDEDNEEIKLCHIEQTKSSLRAQVA